MPTDFVFEVLNLFKEITFMAEICQAQSLAEAVERNRFQYIINAVQIISLVNCDHIVSEL